MSRRESPVSQRVEQTFGGLVAGPLLKYVDRRGSNPDDAIGKRLDEGHVDLVARPAGDGKDSGHATGGALHQFGFSLSEYPVAAGCLDV